MYMCECYVLLEGCLMWRGERRVEYLKKAILVLTEMYLNCKVVVCVCARMCAKINRGIEEVVKQEVHEDDLKARESWRS